MNGASELSGYTGLPEPDLLFEGNRRHKHPLVGLLNYGPYGQKLSTLSALRLAMVAPKQDLGRLTELVTELGSAAEPRRVSMGMRHRLQVN